MNNLFQVLCSKQQFSCSSALGIQCVVGRHWALGFENWMLLLTALFSAGVWVVFVGANGKHSLSWFVLYCCENTKSNLGRKRFLQLRVTPSSPAAKTWTWAGPWMQHLKQRPWRSAEPSQGIINPENARQTFLPADLIEAILQVKVSFSRRLQFESRWRKLVSAINVT